MFLSKQWFTFTERENADTVSMERKIQFLWKYSTVFNKTKCVQSLILYD